MASVILYPPKITHYYEACQGLFRSLSDISLEQAESVLQQIRREGEVFASRRKPDYLEIRMGLEQQIRRLFIEKGGQPKATRPHDFILGSCGWVKTWYREGREVSIQRSALEPGVVGFTYGDFFPEMRYQDGRPYRAQVYFPDELAKLVQDYGLPQEWS